MTTNNELYFFPAVQSHTRHFILCCIGFVVCALLVLNSTSRASQNTSIQKPPPPIVVVGLPFDIHAKCVRTSRSQVCHPWDCSVSISTSNVSWPWTQPLSQLGSCDCVQTMFTAAAHTNKLYPFPFADDTTALKYSSQSPMRLNLDHTRPFKKQGSCYHNSRHLNPNKHIDFTEHCANKPHPNEPVELDDCTYALTNSMFFVPEAKLLFCGIPKNGVTGYLQLIRRLMGAADYLSMPYFKADLMTRRLGQLPKPTVQRLLNDQRWRKIVFFRDPAERLLSAFLDKLHNRDPGIRAFFNKQFGKPAEYLMSFAEFVDYILNGTGTSAGSPCITSLNSTPNSGLTYCHNPHWRPQLFNCGLDVLLPLFDVIGSSEHLGSQSMTLLSSLGLKEESDWGWEGRDETNCCVPPPFSHCTSTGNGEIDDDDDHHRHPSVATVGFNQRLSGWNDTHATHAETRMKEYYTPQLLQTVRTAYSMDYAVIEKLGGLGPTIHSGAKLCT
eukprot:m.97574 g.97574  ORF g.97574 m.97574 type:complete len:498 (-) comp26989_c1_seq1:97-1590(-)